MLDSKEDRLLLGHHERLEDGRQKGNDYRKGPSQGVHSRFGVLSHRRET